MRRLIESSCEDKEVRLQIGRVSRMRKEEECCQKFNKKFWRNRKSGCSLAHAVFTCTHFPLYWEVMWVWELCECACVYCSTKKSLTYVPSEPSCL